MQRLQDHMLGLVCAAEDGGGTNGIPPAGLPQIFIFVNAASRDFRGIWYTMPNVAERDGQPPRYWL